MRGDFTVAGVGARALTGVAPVLLTCGYVIGKGVDGSRITAKGYGESQPAADNATAEGRARNRRVELRRLN